MEILEEGTTSAKPCKVYYPCKMFFPILPPW
jgi:hypothetical protein